MLQISGKENAYQQNLDRINGSPNCEDVKNAKPGRPTQASKQIDIAKGKFFVPDDLDVAADDKIQMTSNQDALSSAAALIDQFDGAFTELAK